VKTLAFTTELYIQFKTSIRSFIIYLSVLQSARTSNRSFMIVLSAPRRLREARKRGAERTFLVRQHHRLPMNAIFDAD